MIMKNLFRTIHSAGPNRAGGVIPKNLVNTRKPAASSKSNKSTKAALAPSTKATRTKKINSADCIDLRSDTITRPTPEMRKAMMKVPVGDDVFRDDPTINIFQREIA